MKNFLNVFFVLVIFGLFGLAAADGSREKKFQNDLKTSLTQYFGQQKYKIINNGIDISGDIIFLAVQYVDKKDSRAPIFKNGIAVVKNGNVFEPVLYFENNLILGKNKKILVDLRPHKHKCYGWFFNTSGAKLNEVYHKGFSINVAWVFDENHLNITQDPPISIKWDGKKKEFYEYVYPNE